MDIPKPTVRATWARGHQVEWWEWEYDEEKGTYTATPNDEVLTAEGLILMATKMHAEGWVICRAVV